MSKVKIIDRRSEKSIKSEREFLSKLHHPFIVNMACSFQDYENLYLVMDLLTGGDLRYHLCHLHKFTEKETKFFFACLLLGLEYIHGNNIIHRDIKPENLVCDKYGYIRITDFGVAKIMKEDNSSETSGTPGYMAPEVLFAQNHSFTVDFYAIGIMGYEFMLGQRPYIGKNRKEIKKLVIEKEAKIKYDDIPEGWNYESVDFINRCLKRKWRKRLGYNNGVIELKNHSWFKGFNWDKLYDKKKIAPFIPKRGDNFDKKYCEAIEKITDKTKERYQKYKNQNHFKSIFNEYTFINYEVIPEIFIETNSRVTTKTTYNKINKKQNTMNYGEIHDAKNLEEKKYLKYKNFFKIENNEEMKLLLDKINYMKDSKNHKKLLNLDNIDTYLKLKKIKLTQQENNELIFSKSAYKNIKNIFSNIKKLSNSTRNKITKNSHNSLIDTTNTNITNLKNNLSKYKNKTNDINIRYINNKYRIRNNSNNGSLSNPTRKKLSLKLHKSNSFFVNSLLNQKTNKNRDKEISMRESEENSNKYINLKMCNYIQLRKIKEGKKIIFDFPYLNKDSNLNIKNFKEKEKLNLDENKINQKNNYNFNSRNRHFLTPMNKNLKKSESDFSFKMANVNMNTLNRNFSMNLDEIENSNLYNTKKFKNYSKREVHKRKK